MHAPFVHLSRFYLLSIYQFHPGPFNRLPRYPLFLYPLLVRALTLGGASTVMKRGRALAERQKETAEDGGRET